MTAHRLQFWRQDEPKAATPVLYRGCGLDNVYLLNGFRIKELEGESYMSVSGVDGLHLAIAFALATFNGPLGAKEFRFLRRFVGGTQEELAKRFQVSRATVNRYETGEEKDIPKASRVLLQLRALKALLERTAEMAKSDPVAAKGMLSDVLEDLTDLEMEHPEAQRPSPVESPPAFVLAAMESWHAHADVALGV